MNILAARRGLSPRSRAFSLEEQEPRRLAYAIKSTASPGPAFAALAFSIFALAVAIAAGVTPNHASASVSVTSSRKWLKITRGEFPASIATWSTLFTAARR